MAKFFIQNYKLPRLWSTPKPVLSSHMPWLKRSKIQKIQTSLENEIKSNFLVTDLLWNFSSTKFFSNQEKYLNQGWIHSTLSQALKPEEFKGLLPFFIILSLQISTRLKQSSIRYQFTSHGHRSGLCEGRTREHFLW